jgi:hypothetical protein
VQLQQLAAKLLLILTPHRLSAVRRGETG